MESADLERLLADWRRELPDAEIHLTGSASVDGLPANDVDLVALVEDVPATAEELRGSYPPLYEEHWSDEWAAFRVAGPPQVDVVLTRRGTRWDAQHRLTWELIRRDDALFAEYAALKSDPTDPTDLAARKAAFFERVVGLLPPDQR